MSANMINPVACTELHTTDPAYSDVDDVAAAAGRARTLGGEVLRDCIEIPPARSASSATPARRVRALARLPDPYLPRVGHRHRRSTVGNAGHMIFTVISQKAPMYCQGT